MADSLFEQYKAALRRGHLAVIAGDLEGALEAYRDAARIVPTRALPHASQGTVLHRLGRSEESEAAFAVALRLAPDDPGVVAALEATRREPVPPPVEPARVAEPIDLAPPPESPVEATADAADLIALDAAAAAPASAEPAVDWPDADEDLGMPDGWLSEPPALQPEGPELGDDGQPVPWPPIDLPSPPPAPIVGPPPDTEALMAEARDLVAEGDLDGARERMLTAVMVHRGAGRPDAALDACLQLLAVAPGDAQVHLAIAGLQLDRGWTELATEKINLLLRLASLTGDTQAAADAHALAAERIHDESGVSPIAIP